MHLHVLGGAKRVPPCGVSVSSFVVGCSFVSKRRRGRLGSEPRSGGKWKCRRCAAVPDPVCVRAIVSILFLIAIAGHAKTFRIVIASCGRGRRRVSEKVARARNVTAARRAGYFLKNS